MRVWATLEIPFEHGSAERGCLGRDVIIFEVVTQLRDRARQLVGQDLYERYMNYAPERQDSVYINIRVVLTQKPKRDSVLLDRQQPEIVTGYYGMLDDSSDAMALEIL